VLLQCCDGIESANSKRQWTPERNVIESHAAGLSKTKKDSRKEERSWLQTTSRRVIE
jgi:hypothetical protein